MYRVLPTCGWLGGGCWRLSSARKESRRWVGGWVGERKKREPMGLEEEEEKGRRRRRRRRRKGLRIILGGGGPVGVGGWVGGWVGV